LENRPGRLLYLLSILGEADINLIAHNIVDASDFGIVHMLLSDPDHALQVIRDAGLTASKTTVLRVSVPDEPGAFVERVLEPLANAKVNIEYSYAYSEGCSGEAMIVLKVDDVAKGESILQEANVE
jgi:hypothetical protein